MTDKDGNSVYRCVAYKSQVDDVIKACRRSGFNAREFVYNKQQWAEDDKARS